MYFPLFLLFQKIKQESLEKMELSQTDSGVDVPDSSNDLSELLDIIKQESERAESVDQKPVTVNGKKLKKSVKISNHYSSDSDKSNNECSTPLKRKSPLKSPKTERNRKDNETNPYSSRILIKQEPIE